MPNPRIDPQQYGPQQGMDTPVDGGPSYVRSPLTDAVAEMRDALSSVDPEMAYLVDAVAANTKKRSGADLLLDEAFKGNDLSVLRGNVEAADASEEAYQMALETMKLSDKDFERLMGELEGAMALPELPEMGQPQQPGQLEQGLAALLSIGTPEHAFEIGSVPYQNEMRKVEQQYLLDQQRYGQKMAQREAKIRMTELRLSQADKRREEARQRIYQLQEAAIKKGDQKEAAGWKLRAEIYSAKSVEEIDDRVQAMREQGLSQYLPGQGVLDGLKATIKAQVQAEKDKLEHGKQKEEADRVSAVADDFARWVDDFRPSDRAITEEDVKTIRAEAKKWAEDNKVPLHRLAIPGVRGESPAFQFRQNTEFPYRQEQDRQAQTNFESRGLAEGWLTGDIGNTRPNVGFKDKKAKQAAVTKLDSQIQELRDKTQRAMFAVSLPFEDPDKEPQERTKRSNQVEEALHAEYTKVMEKRVKVGGKRISFSEYVKQQYPEYAKGFFQKAFREVSKGLSVPGVDPKNPPSVKSGGYKIEVER
jgi:hypothetical protein